MPVNIVVGEKNPPGMQQVARELAAAIPQATHRVLAGQDHMVSAKALLPLLTNSVANE